LFYENGIIAREYKTIPDLRKTKSGALPIFIKSVSAVYGIKNV